MLLLLLLLSTAMVGTGTSAELGCSAVQQLLPIVRHCCYPAWGFYSTFPLAVKCHTKLKSPEQRSAFLSVPLGRRGKRRSCCNPALLHRSSLWPGTGTSSWTAPHSVTPAAQPAQGMAPVPTQQVCQGSFCSQGTRQHVAFFGTGSFWPLGRGGDTAAAGAGSPSLPPEAVWQDSTGASTGPQETESQQRAAPLGSLGPP